MEYQLLNNYFDSTKSACIEASGGATVASFPRYRRISENRCRGRHLGSKCVSDGTSGGGLASYRCPPPLVRTEWIRRGSSSYRKDDERVELSLTDIMNNVFLCFGAGPQGMLRGAAPHVD